MWGVLFLLFYFSTFLVFYFSCFRMGSPELGGQYGSGRPASCPQRCTRSIPNCNDHYSTSPWLTANSHGRRRNAGAPSMGWRSGMLTCRSTGGTTFLLCFFKLVKWVGTFLLVYLSKMTAPPFLRASAGARARRPELANRQVDLVIQEGEALLTARYTSLNSGLGIETG